MDALKNTPLPILLVLAGVFLIVLAFVTKIGGIIEVQPSQKGPAIVIGLLLLVVGIVLNSAPPSGVSSTQNPSIKQSPTQSPLQVSPVEKSSPDSTPSQEPLTPTNTYREKYAKGEYPMRGCGRFSGYPVYPIFISRGSSGFERSENFERVKKDFCQDAIDSNGRIRVASFTEEKEADMFLEFIKEHFDEAWKGAAQ